MRRFALLLSMSALVFASACSDRATSPIAAPAAPRRSIEPPGQLSCAILTDAQILALIDAVYANGSPDEQSALGKWDNITKQRAAGDREDLLKEKVLDLVDFTLEKNTQGKLVATDTALAELLNALFCYAGLANEYYYPGGGGDLIYPTDQAKVVYEKNGFAAMSLPANAVYSPTLITITRTSTALNTELDTYPANFEFSKYPADEPFAKLVVSEVCAIVDDQTTFDALVLGHNKRNGEFELLPEPENYTSVLTRCNQLTASAKPSLGDRLLAFVMPRTLYAASMLAGGGVAGSVLELSPIGPVDPRINVTKLGGNASAPIGSLVSPAPAVRLSTPLGNPLAGITVHFTAASGATYADDATIGTPSALTDANGEAGTAWRLGISTALSYGLTATPQVGGTVAVTGVDFIPDLQSFEANALPAAGLVITSTQGTTTAGETIATVSAKVVDAENRTAEGYVGNVTVAAPSGVTLSGITSKAVEAGLVSFTDLSITKAGTHTLTLTAAPGSFSATTNVTIAKGAARITVASTNPQTVSTPTTLNASPSMPRVRVADQFGNLYVNADIFWRPFGGSTVPDSTTVTDANGYASSPWTLEEGTNTMLVTLDDPAQIVPNRYVEFSATAGAPKQSTTLASCALGNNRTDLAPTYFRFPTLIGGNRSPARLDEVKFFLSVTGDANPNDPKVYQLMLIATETVQNSTGAWVTSQVDTAFAGVLLKGNASQDAPANFVFPGGYTPTANARVSLKIRKVLVNGTEQAGNLRVNLGNCNNSALVVMSDAVPLTSNTPVLSSRVAFQVYGATR